jgi:hypothetical protein
MSTEHPLKSHHGGGAWELLYKRNHEGKENENENREFIIRIADRNLLEKWKKGTY